MPDEPATGLAGPLPPLGLRGRQRAVDKKGALRFRMGADELARPCLRQCLDGRLPDRPAFPRVDPRLAIDRLDALHVGPLGRRVVGWNETPHDSARGPGPIRRAIAHGSARRRRTGSGRGSPGSSMRQFRCDSSCSRARRSDWLRAPQRDAEAARMGEVVAGASAETVGVTFGVAEEQTWSEIMQCLRP